MATVQTLDPLQQQNQQQQGQQNTSAAQPITLSGTAPSSGSSAPAGKSAAPTVANKPSSSGSFTNLTNYLNANSGYNQSGGGLAGKISSNVQGQAQDVQKSLDNAQQQFNTAAQQNAVSYDPNLVGQATANASQFSQNASDAGAFDKLLNAQYQGPTSLDQTQVAQLSNQAQNVGALANLGQNESGRYALLSKLYGSPQYSQGQQSLDNLLIQANPDQAKALSALPGIVQPLNTNINNAVSQSQATGQQLQQQATDVRSQTQGALSDAIRSFLDQANQSSVGIQGQQQQAYQNAVDQLKSGDLSAFGGPSSAPATYNIDPTKYLSQAQAPTLASSLTPEQSAQIQGLARLSGNTFDPSSQAGKILNQFAGKQDLVGTAANAITPTFDNAAYTNALNSAQNNFLSDYAKSLTPIQTRVQEGNSVITRSGASNSPGYIAGTGNTGSGGIESTGDPVKDLALLQADVKQKNDANAKNAATSAAANPLFNGVIPGLFSDTSQPISVDELSQIQKLQDLLKGAGYSAGSYSGAAQNAGLSKAPTTKQ